MTQEIWYSPLKLLSLALLSYFLPAIGLTIWKGLNFELDDISPASSKVAFEESEGHGLEQATLSTSSKTEEAQSQAHDLLMSEQASLDQSQAIARHAPYGSPSTSEIHLGTTYVGSKGIPNKQYSWISFEVSQNIGFLWRELLNDEMRLELPANANSLIPVEDTSIMNLLRGESNIDLDGYFGPNLSLAAMFHSKLTTIGRIYLYAEKLSKDHGLKTHLMLLIPTGETAPTIIALSCESNSEIFALCFKNLNKTLSESLEDSMISIREAERKSGLDLFSSLSPDRQEQIELYDSRVAWITFFSETYPSALISPTP